MIALRRSAGLLLCVLLLGACGVEQLTAAPPTPLTEPLSQPWPVDAVHRDADPKVVVVDLAEVPAADQPEPCAVDVTFELNERRKDTVTVAMSLRGRAQPPYPGCVTTTRAVRVPLPEVLGRRDVAAEGSAQVRLFKPAGSGYALCQQPTCDPSVSRDPADCSNLREAVARTDTPAHFRMSGPCEDPFAALVVDYGVGACPGDGEGGGREACAGKRLKRQFWKASGTTWRLVLESPAGTCADAHAVDPTFPAALCAHQEWLDAT